MPYIKQEDRKKYDDNIASIVEVLLSTDEDSAKGELNYIIYSIIKKYIISKGERYFRYNDFVGGVLSCCQMELYRRLVEPYEDKAKDKNGDV
jgi:hypothetical protein